MFRYILKRLLWLAFTLLGVIFLTFTIMYFLRGSNLPVLLSPDEPPDGLSRALEHVGLYGTYLGDFLYFLLRYVARLQFTGLVSGKLTDINTLSTRYLYTLISCLSAVAVSWIVGLPLGIAAATRSGGFLDNVVSALTVGFGSMPTFWVGLMLLMLFASKLRIVPMLFVGLPSLILPVVTLSLSNISLVTSAARSSVLETLDKDFIMAARAKGLRESLVIWRHGVRNSVLPLLSTLGSQLTKALTGALVVEYVFSIPGIGRLMFDSISNRDFNTVLICILITAVTSGAINVVTDVLYTFINPAVKRRYE